MFGPKGACAGCWCMWWRLTGAQWKAGDGVSRRLAFKRLVARGPAPGILAYEGDEAVGWCAVRPREDFPRFEKSRHLKRLDERPVWSLNCFFIRRDHRGRGLTRRLIEAAKKHVRESGGRMLEAYPVVPKAGAAPDVWAFTGMLPSFEKCGFREAARPGARAIVRFELK